MSPAQIIAEMHENTPGAGFADALAAHMAGNGVVISTPTAAAMLRPVAMVTDLADPWQCVPGSSQWYVWAAAGDLAELLRWWESMTDISAIAYHRHGRMVIRSRHEIRKLQRRAGRSREEPEAI